MTINFPEIFEDFFSEKDLFLIIWIKQKSIGQSNTSIRRAAEHQELVESFDGNETMASAFRNVTAKFANKPALGNN